MTRIESRPSQKRKWDYVFFIDIEGHVEDPPVAAAMADLQNVLRCCGCWARIRVPSPPARSDIVGASRNTRSSRAPRCKVR